MTKRAFYIKVIALFVISGVAKSGIDAISKVGSAPTTVVNNHEHNTYEAPAPVDADQKENT